jgi:hypothetical protein
LVGERGSGEEQEQRKRKREGSESKEGSRRETV